MTENDAKDTRCCGPNGCGEVRDSGRGSPANQERYCVGSACMAWRWDDELLPKPNSLSQGHCGLAGKP